VVRISLGRFSAMLLRLLKCVRQNTALCGHRGEDEALVGYSKARQAQVQKNLEALLPIIDTLLTCAWQNTALCGHHGEDEAFVGYSEPAENDGNFLALSCYRMHGGDVAQCNHLTGAAAMLRTCL